MDMMDHGDMMEFIHTIIFKLVWQNIWETRFAAQYVAYFMVMLKAIMGFAAAGYVVVRTVNSGISFDRGHYFNFANVSNEADNLYYYELVVIILMMLWSLVITLLHAEGAILIWKNLDTRLLEASTDSLGIETPLSW